MERLALVTGGSRGLGRQTALSLAERGVDVVITYQHRQEDALAVVAQLESGGRRAAALQLDISRCDQFPNFIAELRQLLARWDVQGLDYLVNNAGSGVHAAFAETTEAQFDQMVDIHLKGVFFLTQAVVPLLVDGASIVNISSGLARFSLPGYAAYAAMKGGVEVLTRYLAKELGERRIRVNTVAPGAIETDFGGGLVRDNSQVNAMIASSTALGRVGLPEDIGGMIASLLGDENRWVNGQRIEVSGGIFL